MPSTFFPSASLNAIHHGQCEDLLLAVPDGSIDLLATDPPFNIDLDYNEYVDRRPHEEYVGWSRAWIKESYRVLRPGGSIYVLAGDECAAEIKCILREVGFTFRNWIIWAYGFGQNQRLKFSRCHTHALYFTKPGGPVTFNAGDILIPSARQKQYADPRAKRGGKVPGDIWTVYADDHHDSSELRLYPDELLIWDDSRLCGTFNERLKKEDGSAHPCQMPLSVMERIVAASSNEGDVVGDWFSGTATGPLAAYRSRRNFIAFERDPEYVKLGRDRLAKAGCDSVDKDEDG